MTFRNQKAPNYVCECGRAYTHRQGLYTHRKTCVFEPQQTQNDDMMTKMMELIKLQTEQQTEVMKIMAQNQGSRTTNTTKNTQNITINNYLKTDCKDAIDMSEFISNFEFTTEHLELSHTQGLERGITQSILDNIKKLPMNKRPLVCADIKRELLYVKEDGEWDADTAKDKLKRLANRAQNKGYIIMAGRINSNKNFYNDENAKDFISSHLSSFGKSLDENNIQGKILKNVCNETYYKDLLKQ